MKILIMKANIINISINEILILILMKKVMCININIINMY